jgi:hypothetical protein
MAWENGILRLSVTIFQSELRVDLLTVDLGQTYAEKVGSKNESVVGNGVVGHELVVVGVLRTVYCRMIHYWKVN